MHQIKVTIPRGKYLMVKHMFKQNRVFEKFGYLFNKSRKRDFVFMTKT